jgi:hypothetical protein
MRLGLPVLALATLIAASVTSRSFAAAEADTDAAFVKRLFGRTADPKKSYACFVRQYDADHLAHHPLQKVSAMKLLVTAERDAESEEPIYSFRLGLNYRNRRGVFDSSGGCRRGETADGGQFGCGVDCDGGAIGVEFANGDKSVLLKVDRIRIWRSKNQPDEEASKESLVAGADDRVFRLDRTSLDDCKSLVTDRKELAAIRRI